jgi:hypothetical protein
VCAGRLISKGCFIVGRGKLGVLFWPKRHPRRMPLGRRPPFYLKSPSARYAIVTALDPMDPAWVVIYPLARGGPCSVES